MRILKNYQEKTKESLQKYLRLASSLHDVKKAYEICTLENFGKEGVYNDPGFPNVPYVCLRVPTGGGKTLLASYTIPMVTKDYLSKDSSFVVWLVPSTTILEQTINALQTPKHWYREVLDKDLDGNVSVMSLEDALYLTPSTVRGNTCIIVSTLQAWRQTSTEGRKVYQDNGSLKQFFDSISVDKRKQLEHFDNGVVLKNSLANVIYLQRPILIVDEAHNARTPLTFETLQRLNPSCIVEYTATPLRETKDRSNVLYNVSAATLKAEDMIKMPIELVTKEDWHNVVKTAVEKQRELTTISVNEEAQTGEYLRPIVLLQAEPDYKDKSSVNVDEIKKFLIETCAVDESEIAIEIGGKSEIDGENLLERICTINFIITKQKLKEGWDCPFAYIFCSVATVRSSKDVEQLLGRILRLPNVQKKQHEELNRAYAFVYSKDFFHTANNLTDSLVKSGFTPNEAESLIEIKKPQIELPLELASLTRTFVQLPDISKLSKETRDKIEIDKRENTFTLTKPITPEECEAIKQLCEDSDDQEIVDQLYRNINRIDVKYISPAKRGESFVVPQLLLEFDGELQVFDEEVLISSSWNLANCNAELTEKEFSVTVDSGEKGLIDVDSKGATVIHSPKVIQEEISNIFVSSVMQKPELIHWLVKETRHPSVTHSQQIVFIGKVIESLQEKRKLNIDHLVFMRHRLRDILLKKIGQYFNEAKKKGFEDYLFTSKEVVKDFPNFFKIGKEIQFGPIYPVNTTYRGKLRYKKHFFELISDMNDEEAECASVIDGNPNVDFWIRNLERQEQHSFWLQTSTDKFYPDFLVKLKNGIVLAIEYKGSDRYDNPDSVEKKTIGDVWETISEKKCGFVMLKGKDWNKLREKLNK